MFFVMRGLDPRICRVKEDGRIKSGHDVVGGFRRNDDVAGMIREMAGSPPGHDGSCSTSCADLIRASAASARWPGLRPAMTFQLCASHPRLPFPTFYDKLHS